MPTEQHQRQEGYSELQGKRLFVRSGEHAVAFDVEKGVIRTHWSKLQTFCGRLAQGWRYEVLEEENLPTCSPCRTATKERM